MNHVYFDKRRLYLAGVLSLLSNDSKYDVSIAHFKGDSRKPIIHIASPSNSITIRLIPVVSIYVRCCLL